MLIFKTTDGETRQLRCFSRVDNKPSELTQCLSLQDGAAQQLYGKSPGVRIAVLTNTNVVIYNAHEETDSVANLLRMLSTPDFNVETFTALDKSSLQALLADKQALVLPYLRWSLLNRLDSESRGVIRQFVLDGGQLFCCQEGYLPEFLGAVFYWNLSFAEFESTFTAPGDMAGFESLPAELGYTDYIRRVVAGLPGNTAVRYGDSHSGTGLCRIPCGSGAVIWAGWSWYHSPDPAHQAAQDNWYQAAKTLLR